MVIAVCRVELIGGAAEADMRLVEWPQLGISVELAAGFSSYRTGTLLKDDRWVRSRGAPTLSLGVGWRIPWIPIADLLLRSDITFLVDTMFLDAGATPLIVDVGFEKRWSWGRIIPIVGASFTTAMFRISTDKFFAAQGIGTASAHAYGATGYAGLGVALTPGSMLKFKGAYRLIPSAGPVTVEKDGREVARLTEPEGGDFQVYFGGLFAMGSFEMTF